MASGALHDPDPIGDQVRRRVEHDVRLLLHEIRQPLAAVFALAEAARSLPSAPAEVRHYLDQIIGQTQEVSSAAWSVLNPVVATTASEARAVDAGEVVDSVMEGFGLTWPGTLLRRGDRGSSPVVGDRAAVRRCLTNVVDNAVRAAGPAGRVTITVRRGPEVVRILVEDDGPGFGADGPHGSGLGLAITRTTMESMGGHLSAGPPSRTGGGAVALSLPTPTAGGGYADRPARAM